MISKQMRFTATLMLVILVVGIAATSVSTLTRITSLTADDLVLVTDNPDVAPASRSITAANMRTFVTNGLGSYFQPKSSTLTALSANSTVGTGRIVLETGSLDAASIVSGVFPPARLGTGTLGAGTYLRGDGQFVAIPGGGDMLRSVYDQNVDSAVDVAAGGTGSTTASGARAALGVEIGVNVEAYSANSTKLGSTIEEAEINLSDNTVNNATVSRHGFLPKLSGDTSTFLRGDGTYVTPTGSGDMVKATYDSDGDGIFAVTQGGTGSSTPANARANLGLTIGTHVQGYDAELGALAGTTSAANKLPYFTGSGAASTADFSAFARTLIDDADAATARTTLGAPGVASDNTLSGSNTVTGSVTMKPVAIQRGSSLLQYDTLLAAFNAATNNDTILVRPGTHAVSTHYYSTDVGDLRDANYLWLQSVTNVTVRGEKGSVIQASDYGNIVTIDNCQRITFDGLTIIGSETGMDATKNIAAAINHRRTNSITTIKNCYFKDIPDQAISHCWDQYNRPSTYWTVQDCTFENVGQDDHPHASLTVDGACVSGRPRQLIFTGNRTKGFIAFGIELDGGGSADPGGDSFGQSVISGNIFHGLFGYGLNLVGQSDNRVHDIVVTGNEFEPNETLYVSTYLVTVVGASDVLFSGNVFKGPITGASAPRARGISINETYGSHPNTTNIVIQNNLFSGLSYGVGVSHVEAHAATVFGVRVEGNTFIDQGESSVYLAAAKGLVVKDNLFFGCGRAAVPVQPWAIHIYDFTSAPADDLIVSGNILNDIATTATTTRLLRIDSEDSALGPIYVEGNRIVRSSGGGTYEWPAATTFASLQSMGQIDLGGGEYVFRETNTIKLKVDNATSARVAGEGLFAEDGKYIGWINSSGVQDTIMRRAGVNLVNLFGMSLSNVGTIYGQNLTLTGTFYTPTNEVGTIVVTNDVEAGSFTLDGTTITNWSQVGSGGSGTNAASMVITNFFATQWGNISGTAVDLAGKTVQSKSVSGDTTLTFSGTPVSGQWQHVVVTNTDTAAHTLTFPSAYSITLGANTTSIQLPATNVVWLTFAYDGAKWNVSCNGSVFEAASATITGTLTVGTLNTSVLNTDTLGVTGLIHGAALAVGPDTNQVYALAPGSNISFSTNGTSKVLTIASSSSGTTYTNLTETNYTATARNLAVSTNLTVEQYAYINNLIVSNLMQMMGTNSGSIKLNDGQATEANSKFAVITTPSVITNSYSMALPNNTNANGYLYGTWTSTTNVQLSYATPSRTGVPREIWIPANAMNPGASGSPAASTNVWATTTDGQSIEAWDFDASSDEAVQFTLTLPAAWDASTVKAKLFWKPVNATTGNCDWSIAGGSINDSETGGNTLGTAVDVADAVQTGTNTVHITAATGAITIGGTPSAGHMVWFKVSRDADDGTNDTMSNDARLLGVQLQYTETATEPAAW